MDITTRKLQDLYNDMFAELKSEVEALDGVIEEFNPDDKIMSITVDPELQEYLEILLVDLTTKYDHKKNEIFQQDPFHGVKVLIGS